MSSSSGQRADIYVTLDVLLDTRLGTLAKINQQLAKDALASEYHTRLSDEFKGITKQEFQQQYRQRDTITLAHSVLTDAIRHIRYLANDLTAQSMTRPHLAKVKVVVNVFPYVLSSEEQDAIGRAITVQMGSMAPVELVSISPINLTPKHCRDSYTFMMMYEYEEWLDIHTEAFKQTRLPQVTLFVPALYFNVKPTEEELKELTKEAAHPLKALELLASPIIDLKVIDVKFFSIIKK